jgi:PTS system galactitol-specific IIA component
MSTVPVTVPELVSVRLLAADRVEAISELADLLEQGGYVKPSFKTAVLEREVSFPTGLPTGEVGVAIPHADSIHVLRSAVGVGLLEKPIRFLQMGDPDASIDVDLVLMLAIEDPKAVVPFLRKICSILQDGVLLQGIRTCNNPGEASVLLQSRLNG